MIFNTLALDADTEWLMLDSTSVRVHQCAARAKNLWQTSFRGGFSTKIHALCDALGNPLRFILSPGQPSDYKQALNLRQGFQADAVLVDRSYDADYLIQAIHESEAETVIPARKNRKQPRQYDSWLYTERNLVECLFNKLKNFRRVATRYDKTNTAYLSFIHLAGIYLWLK